MTASAAITSVDQAYGILFRRVVQPLRRALQPFGLERHEIDDVINEKFIKFVDSRVHRLASCADFERWMFCVCINGAKNVLRAQKRRARHEFAVGDDLEGFGQVQEDADEQPWADVDLANLSSIVAALPEKDRFILDLWSRRVPGKEIADALGITRNNLDVRIHRLKTKIRNQLNMPH